ncbi:hypothetical protein V865_006521 [Kwoniella europaea PYCC6329]|uniref:Zn(2)-C6 fungal-type domain-containing protein n=1 Tax=Kwoniella europaea PYCC6329 TaxID=1423913 RepID=A0AAX4KR29_9TREE
MSHQSQILPSSTASQADNATLPLVVTPSQLHHVPQPDRQEPQDHISGLSLHRGGTESFPSADFDFTIYQPDNTLQESSTMGPLGDYGNSTPVLTPDMTALEAEMTYLTSPASIGIGMGEGLSLYPYQDFGHTRSPSAFSSISASSTFKRQRLGLGSGEWSTPVSPKQSAINTLYRTLTAFGDYHINSPLERGPILLARDRLDSGLDIETIGIIRSRIEMERDKPEISSRAEVRWMCKESLRALEILQQDLTSSTEQEQTSGDTPAETGRKRPHPDSLPEFSTPFGPSTDTVTSDKVSMEMAPPARPSRDEAAGPGPASCNSCSKSHAKCTNYVSTRMDGSVCYGKCGECHDGRSKCSLADRDYQRSYKGDMTLIEDFIQGVKSTRARRVYSSLEEKEQAKEEYLASSSKSTEPEEAGTQAMESMTRRDEFGLRPRS